MPFDDPGDQGGGGSFTCKNARPSHDNTVAPHGWLNPDNTKENLWQQFGDVIPNDSTYVKHSLDGFVAPYQAKCTREGAGSNMPVPPPADAQYTVVVRALASNPAVHPHGFQAILTINGVQVWSRSYGNDNSYNYTLTPEYQTFVSVLSGAETDAAVAAGDGDWNIILTPAGLLDSSGEDFRISYINVALCGHW